LGSSTGAAPDTVAGMARDAISLIDALGLKQVDLFASRWAETSLSRSRSIDPSSCGE
jgi:hypothetical protein